MPRKRSRKTTKPKVTTADYRHGDEKRKNIPPAKIAAEGKVPKAETVRYQYSEHLRPALRFDRSGRPDAFPGLIAKAGKQPLTEAEQRMLADALRTQRPWLEWAGKQEQDERGFFEVDPVALHIHERVSTQAIMRAVAREDVQRELFADPQQSYAEAVQFYRHDVDWANRLILGDSLQVMASLGRREDLAGKVQVIYMDPPYGIKFASNFQPQMGNRDVKDREQDLTREPEMVKAYRDSWTLGVHSYLTYLRDRLRAARELLTDDGAIFVQIGDENIHRVRCLLDDVFGDNNFVSLITFRTSVPLGATYVPGVCNYVLFYARNREQLKFRRVFREKAVGEGGAYNAYVLPSGEIRTMRKAESTGSVELPDRAQPFFNLSMLSAGTTRSCVYEMEAFGRKFNPGGGRSWKTNPEGFSRLVKAERIIPTESTLRYILLHSDYSVGELVDLWADVGSVLDKIYVVQTNIKVVERCLLMTSDPGDLVLDPTCGSGTTAYVAEKWGRRWITCDTSRVALSLARHRLMTSKFDYYRLRSVGAEDVARNPNGTWLTDQTGEISGKATLDCEVVPHVTLGSIARNVSLDPIVAKHEPILARALEKLNIEMAGVGAAVKESLVEKLIAKHREQGARAVTEADRRRWLLPDTESRLIRAVQTRKPLKGVTAKQAEDYRGAIPRGLWRAWEVPFDTDRDWPEPLQRALSAYRAARRDKLDEVNACIAANAEVEELVNKPKVVTAVVRVAGPFSVEGVRPEELSLGEDGLFDPTANEFEPGEADDDSTVRNAEAYLSQMVRHLWSDGVTFLNNRKKTFAEIESLFEDSSASVIHAAGAWNEVGSEGDNTVAVSFGPQYGPVTVLQVEEAIREARQYEELVVAGFSFDAETFAVVEEPGHPKLRVHLAQIRPDLNEAMDGLLKVTPNSELFTVFGQPDVDVTETEDGWVCSLMGVEIYDPVKNTVLSAGAEKVAAWFLDSDFDGRCFCVTQAFFPDQNAWEKIARALGGSADPEAFEKLKGTTSLPFGKGKYARIAVKVIDPRGNEVMAIRTLGAS